MIEAAIARWNEGRWPAVAGEHEDLPIFEKADVLADNGYGQLGPFHLTASIKVESHLRYGQLPVEGLSGFKDELSGNLITNAFRTGIFDPMEVLENWREVKPEEDLPAAPVMRLTGLIAWDVQDPSRFYI